MGKISEVCLPIAHILTSPPGRVVTAISGTAGLLTWEIIEYSKPSPNNLLRAVDVLAMIVLATYVGWGHFIHNSLPPCTSSLSRAMLILAHGVTSSVARFIIGVGGSGVGLPFVIHFSALVSNGILFNNCCPRYLTLNATSPCWERFTPATIQKCDLLKPEADSFGKNVAILMISAIAMPLFILYALCFAPCIRRSLPTIVALESIASFPTTAPRTIYGTVPPPLLRNAQVFQEQL